jgi:phosphoribosylaminoimidazolecarboxamide formyltransferase/IMP cyclohydrolase
MLDGRVKTLHPKVHGGLLFIRGNESHEAAVRSHGIEPIDLVVVNLYPFEQTVAKPDVTLHDAIENIDIGGPSMLRSAAKNHESVTVVVDPMDYDEVAAQITANGNTTLELRRKLAAKVFARTAAYDGAIAAHLQKVFNVGQASSLSFSRCVMVKIRIKLRRFTGVSVNFINNCTEKSFRIITSSI